MKTESEYERNIERPMRMAAFWEECERRKDEPLPPEYRYAMERAAVVAPLHPTAGPTLSKCDRNLLNLAIVVHRMRARIDELEDTVAKLQERAGGAN